MQEKPMQPFEVEALIAERLAAKKARNFMRADQIRRELLECGVIIEDTAPVRKPLFVPVKIPASTPKVSRLGRISAWVRQQLLKLAPLIITATLLFILCGCAGVERPTNDRAVELCEKAGGVPTFNWSGYLTLPGASAYIKWP